MLRRVPVRVPVLQRDRDVGEMAGEDVKVRCPPAWEGGTHHCPGAEGSCSHCRFGEAGVDAKAAGARVPAAPPLWARVRVRVPAAPLWAQAREPAAPLWAQAQVRVKPPTSRPAWPVPPEPSSASSWR